MDPNQNNTNNTNRGLPINPVQGQDPSAQDETTTTPDASPETSPVDTSPSQPPATTQESPAQDKAPEQSSPPPSTNNTEITGEVIDTQKIFDLNNEELEEKTVSASSQSGAVSKVGDDPNRAPATGEISTFDQKDQVSEEGAKVLKEQAKAKSLELDEEMTNINTGEGINLIPRKTKAEIKKERRTTGLNLFSAFAILVLVFFSVIILGLNAGMRLWLNREEAVLTDLENDLLAQTEIVRANSEIIERFNLYQDVQQATFSPKEVLVYWRDLVADFGRLDSVRLKNGLNFEVAGESKDLKQLSFLWHLLTIDQKVSNTNLHNFSNAEDASSFTFKGMLNFEYFASQNINLTTDTIDDEPPEEEEVN